MIAIGFPTPLVTYTTGGEPPPFQADAFTPTNSNEPFLTWLQYVLAQPSLPQVISTSYGDIEQTVPYAYAKRVCDGFAQLGARGVSVIFGSGDFGVGRSGYCYSNDGTNTPGFLTSFPDSCPYGTSVGATRGIGPEIVAYNDYNGFVSGGGFSKYFARPSYQERAVSSYIATLGNEFEGMYNKNGRGYPDVAAQGYRHAMVWNGTKYLVDGTSASAPTMAAIISLVNDALIAEGKPPLGFLNPWLYSKGFESFTDVITGSSRGCNTSGFPAAVGWDAASGFGTPVSLRAISVT
jgi:tripeptidyl-peptidase-1